MKKKAKRERKPTKLQQAMADIERLRGKLAASTEKLSMIQSALGFDDLESRIDEIEGRLPW